MTSCVSPFSCLQLYGFPERGGVTNGFDIRYTLPYHCVLYVIDVRGSLMSSSSATCGGVLTFATVTVSSRTGWRKTPPGTAVGNPVRVVCLATTMWVESRIFSKVRSEGFAQYTGTEQHLLRKVPGVEVRMVITDGCVYRMMWG